MLNIAIIGCGYVSDFYRKTLSLYKNLKLIGCFDINRSKSMAFSKVSDCKNYSSLKELLEDSRIDIVVNLTNPREHFEINKQALEHNKHLYCEKPLSVNINQLKDLANTALQKNLYISCAPCNYLSETAQTVLHALETQKIGKPRLVYAEMDDGYLYKEHYKTWKNDHGAYWPYKDEFEVGCVLEHAGYYISWLTMFFGPAKTIFSFSEPIIPGNERADIELDPQDTPDFSVACIKFYSGVVARLTCSIIAPKNRSALIVGDTGSLKIQDCWDYGSQVFYQKIFGSEAVNIPFISEPKKINYQSEHKMDFARGIGHLAKFISNKYSNKLLIDFCLHNNEIALGLAEAAKNKKPYFLKSSFEKINYYEYV